MNKLRIVIVIPYDPYCQPFTIRTVMFCRLLSQRGHQVQLFYTPAPSGRRLREDPLGSFGVIPLHPTSMADLRRLDHAVAASDVVHVQKPHLRSAGPALVLAKLRGKPVHLDWDDDDFAFHLEAMQDTMRTAGLPARERVAVLARAGAALASFGLLERIVPRMADSVGAASMALRKKCIALGVAAGALYPARVGVDAEVFTPHARDSELRRQLRIEGPAVLYSGCFDRVDDLKLFVEVVQHLARLAPAARWVVVGGGAKQPDLVRMLEAAGCASSVALSHGFVPFADMPRWIASCDVAAIPLRDTAHNRSKSSLTALECMACGVPVVTNDVGDMPWLVGEGGIAVGESAPACLAAAVASLCNDPGLRHRQAALARERATTRFGWHETVDYLEQAYQRAVDGRSA